MMVGTLYPSYCPHILQNVLSIKDGLNANAAAPDWINIKKLIIDENRLKDDEIVGWFTGYRFTLSFQRIIHMWHHHTTTIINITFSNHIFHLKYHIFISFIMFSFLN